MAAGSGEGWRQEEAWRCLTERGARRQAMAALLSVPHCKGHSTGSQGLSGHLPPELPLPEGGSGAMSSEGCPRCLCLNKSDIRSRRGTRLELVVHLLFE